MVKFVGKVKREDLARVIKTLPSRQTRVDMSVVRTFGNKLFVCELGRGRLYPELEKMGRSLECEVIYAENPNKIILFWDFMYVKDLRSIVKNATSDNLIIEVDKGIRIKEEV